MKKTSLTISLFLLFVCFAQAQRKICIDRDWRFMLGDGSTAIDNTSVTNGWRQLDLPHDWSVETNAAQMAGGTVVGPFSTNSIGKYQTGNTVGGEGWYYKSLIISTKTSKRYTLYFEGAYNRTEIYINGKKIYFNPYGYSSFRIDVTNILHSGENNLLVRVMNEGSNTRWYAGSGIYRHVWLITTPSVYTDEWDLHLQPSSKSIKMSTTIYNDMDTDQSCEVSMTVLDADGKTVGNVSTNTSVEAWNEQPVALELSLTNPALWSPEHPYLYTAVINVKNQETETTDQLVKHFGVRTLAYSATNGFLLNGESILLKGGCVHHDNGLLGAAAYDRAEVRKLSLLKAQGFNAVRCSHNIPSEHFLDVCDSIGLMVVDESFDQWLLQKNNDDYSHFFKEFSDRDYSMMMRRDRNHPSIVMWSIGNEIPGRINTEGLAVAERLRTLTKYYDEERPVTAAICGWDDGWSGWNAQDEKAYSSLDIGGYNYMYHEYEHDHGTHPNRVMVGLESYAKQASENWTLVEKHPYIIGDFVWTAMDYLGEAGIGSADENSAPSMFRSWPWFNGWCGDIDLIGQKKPQSYYRDVVWREAPVTMAVQPTSSWNSAWGWQLEEQNWTWPGYEGKNVTINVYSRAPQVRLYLNGKSQGDHTTGSTFWTGYNIPYEDGTLRVVNLDASGKEIAEESFELQTTSKPSALRLVADNTQIKADAADLAYVTIELVDAEGRVITSDCKTKVYITAEGDGTLLAAGTACPNDMDSFRSNTPTLFRGRALAILKSTDQAGEIQLTVQAEGLPKTSVVITTEKEEQVHTQVTFPRVNKSFDNAYYTLQGYKVENPTHGTYIHKGQVVFNK